MAHEDSICVVGWISSAGHTLRIVGWILLSTRFRAKGEVRDADGNLVVQPAPPPKVWHECLRHYRVSESSADFYDSFRNLYLAIESLLSDVVAPVMRPNGNPEGDSDWLKRALREVGQAVDLRPYAPVSPKAPHNAIHHELYVNLRTAIFHAKTGRDLGAAGVVVSGDDRGGSPPLRPDVPSPRVSVPRHRVSAGGFAKALWEQTWEAQLCRPRGLCEQ